MKTFLIKKPRCHVLARVIQYQIRYSLDAHRNRWISPIQFALGSIPVSGAAVDRSDGVGRRMSEWDGQRERERERAVEYVTISSSTKWRYTLNYSETERIVKKKKFKCLLISQNVWPSVEHCRIATIEPDTMKCYEKVIVLERFSHNH